MARTKQTARMRATASDTAAVATAVLVGGVRKSSSRRFLAGEAFGDTAEEAQTTTKEQAGPAASGTTLAAPCVTDVLPRDVVESAIDRALQARGSSSGFNVDDILATVLEDLGVEEGQLCMDREAISAYVNSHFLFAGQ